MEIINKDVNVALQHANHFLLGGILSGSMRIVAGLVQAIINVVVGVFLTLGSLCFYIAQFSPYHPSIFFEDAKEGLLHITRGFVEMLPFSEICLDVRIGTVGANGWHELSGSHPYHPVVLVEGYEPWTTMSAYAQIDCC